ncbi:PP2C family protein-serine/threonine phosphatase [Streptomyces sp. TS71-3]|uniref:PP2C family protein-serine/threonine phosphatase n=1 Tax=Streptomyces sp. TS71-3 TaxID=2733862 RepID=UPI001B25519E|nr:SpoIIE family protein phosphatase [Streptomyces sp. TS71-3]GHJ37194.1 histidine kinase [Streptomyces sp. TS71-3]
MSRVSEEPEPSGVGDGAGTDEAFTALLEDSVEELYEAAPCGYLSTMMDGTVVKMNGTLLGWLGLRREAVVGRLHFTDLLTMGGKIHHETHFAPLLRMRGELSGIVLEMRTALGDLLPVLVSSMIKYGTEGDPLLIRTTVFDASDRRTYEEELVRRRQDADHARAEAEHARAEAERARAEAERARAEAERAFAEAEEARRQAEAHESQLVEALDVLQQSLVPASLPVVPGLETAAYYHTAAAHRLGGDFYDLFPIDGKRWGFFLGDVCGKGPQAASLTSLTRYTLRTAALHDPEPAAALTTLNTVLYERYATGDDPRYCTCVFGTVEPCAEPAGATVRLASGGHPPALVLRADGRADFLPTPDGLLIGVLPAAPIGSARITLAPGETILLYTDGLTEARTRPGRGGLYGEDALRAFVAGRAPATPRETVAALTTLLAGFGGGLTDDAALLALGVPSGTVTKKRQE